jgi:hypothetical protein
VALIVALFLVVAAVVVAAHLAAELFLIAVTLTASFGVPRLFTSNVLAVVAATGLAAGFFFDTAKRAARLFLVPQAIESPIGLAVFVAAILAAMFFASTRHMPSLGLAAVTTQTPNCSGERIRVPIIMFSS